MGTNKLGPTISRTVVSPGDDPKHELVVLLIRRDTTTSSDPDWDGTEQIVYQQADQVAGTGPHRGYSIRLHKNGETTYGSFEAETHNHENVIERQNAASAIQRRRERWNGGLKVGCDP
jgi:hypothetical protein